MTAPKTRSDWTSPQTMLAALGMIGMGFASYTAFQRDSGIQIARLDERVKTLEARCK